MYFLLPVLGLIIGLLVGLDVHFKVPSQYGAYLSVAMLAALDTIFGGMKAALQKKFDAQTFLSGFFSNTLLAALFAFVGSLLGVDLALAAVVAFGVRIFNNLAEIRHFILTRRKIQSH